MLPASVYHTSGFSFSASLLVTSLNLWLKIRKSEHSIQRNQAYSVHSSHAVPKGGVKETSLTCVCAFTHVHARRSLSTKRM